MRILSAVVETLVRGDVPFCLIGAGALAAHGVSRSTVDLDLLRVGDAEDPVAGVVRCSGEGGRSVDVVVGRDAWQARIPLRARPVSLGGATLPVASGGAAIRDAVENDLPTLPAECAERWRSVIVP